MTADQIEMMSELLDDARLIKDILREMKMHRKVGFKSEYVNDRGFQSDLCRQEFEKWLGILLDILENKITLCKFAEWRSRDEDRNAD